MKGIHRWLVNSPHKGPIRQKCFHLITSPWDYELIKNTPYITHMGELSDIYCKYLQETGPKWSESSVVLLQIQGLLKTIFVTEHSEVFGNGNIISWLVIKKSPPPTYRALPRALTHWHLNTTSDIFITVTSYWARWRLKSPASRLLIQPFVQAQIKENIKAPRHLPLWGEFAGDQWIPRTKGQ